MQSNLLFYLALAINAITVLVTIGSVFTMLRLLKILMDATMVAR